MEEMSSTEPECCVNLDGDNLIELKVPQDNKSLYWSILLSYLSPVKAADNDLFKNRAENLLGKITDYESEQILCLLKNIHNNTFDSEQIIEQCQFNTNIIKKICTNIGNHLKANRCKYENKLTVSDLVNRKNPDLLEEFSHRIEETFLNEDEQNILPMVYDALKKGNIIEIETELSKVNHDILNDPRYKSLVFDFYTKCIKDGISWNRESDIQIISDLLCCELVLHSELKRKTFSTDFNNKNNDGQNCHTLNIFHVGNGVFNCAIPKSILHLIGDGAFNKRKRACDESDSISVQYNNSKKMHITEKKLVICLKRAHFDTDQYMTTKNKYLRLNTEDNKVTGLRKNFHGSAYQLKTLMLFIKRAYDKGLVFEINTELKQAEKFDDLVFKYIEPNTNTVFYKLIQIKHRQDDTIVISLNDLLAENDGDFCLHKYFASFLKIKRNANIIDKQHLEIVIFSNINFKYNDIRENLVLSKSMFDEEQDAANIFDKKLLRFKNTFEGEEELRSILKNGTEPVKLATALFERIIYDKTSASTKRLQENTTKILKLYQRPLLKEVIDFKTRKLYKNFVTGNNLSEEAQHFRNVFFGVFDEKRKQYNLPEDFTLRDPESFARIFTQLMHRSRVQGKNEILLHKGNQSLKMYLDNLDKLAGWVLVTSNGITKFSSFFLDRSQSLPANLNVFRHELFNNLSNINDLKKVSFKIADFRSCDEIYVDRDAFWRNVEMRKVNLLPFKEIEEIKNVEQIGKQLAHLLILSNSDGRKLITIKRDNYLGKNVDKLAGSVLVESGGRIVFTREFIDGDDLDGSTSLLRLHLKNSLQYELDIESLQNFRFEIVNFPKLVLPAINFEDEISDFLQCLRFALDQPNESELEKIITKEIDSEYSPSMSKDVYCRFQERIFEWMKDPDGHVYTDEDARDFFKNLNHEFSGAIQFQVRPPVDFFTGREQQLRDLHEALKHNRNGKKLTVVSQLASVTGLGGVGKTEMAREYIRRYATEYDNNVIWINAESYSSMKESFLKLAKHPLIDVRIEEDADITIIVSQIYKRLQRRKKRILFVFDNADEYDYSKDPNSAMDEGISPFLPKFVSSDSEQIKPNFLITSRNLKWKNAKVLKLISFKAPEAAEFISKVLGLSYLEHEKDVNQLASELQYFPLALYQAVAYISQEKNYGSSDFGIREYLERLEQKRQKLLDFQFSDDVNTDYKKTTFTTWQITLDKIAKLENGIDAIKILNIISFFSPFHIPTRIFLRCFNNDLLKLGAALQLLKVYSMVDLDSGIMHVHRLVQDVIIYKLRQENRMEFFLRNALSILDEEIAVDSNLNHGISCWKFALNFGTNLLKEFKDLPYNILNKLIYNSRYEESYTLAGSTLGAIEENLKDYKNEDVVKMHKKIAQILYLQGKYKEADVAFREIFQNKERQLKAENVLHLNLRNDFACNLIALGKYSEAESELRNMIEKWKDCPDDILEPKNNLGLLLITCGKYNEAFEILDDLLKDEKIQTHRNIKFTAMGNIATIYLEQCKYEKALKLSEEILKDRKLFCGPQHRNTFQAMNNLAVVLTEMGEFNRALDMLRELKTEEIKLIGADHPSILTTQENIAAVLLEQGKFNEAIKILKDIIHELIAIYGVENPKVFDAKKNLSLALIDQENYDEALNVIHEFADAETRLFGRDHPTRLITQNNLGIILKSQCRLKEALGVFEDIVDVFCDSLGENHSNLLTVQNNLADVLMQLGRYDEALEIFQKISVVSEKNYPNNPTNWPSKNNVAAILKTRGQFEEALRILDELIEAHISNVGICHPGTLSTLHNKAVILKNQGKLKEALDMFRKVAEIRSKVLGANHGDTLETKNEIASILMEEGEREEALELSKYVVDTLTKTLGPFHLRTIKEKLTLADILVNCDDCKEAEQILRNCVENCTEMVGRNHFDVLNLKNSLASILSEQNNFEEAIEILNDVLDVQRKVIGLRHPDTLFTKNNIATTLLKNDQIDDAFIKFKEVVEERLIVLGEEHKDTLESKHQLADVLRKMEKHEEALKIYKEILLVQKKYLSEYNLDYLSVQKHIAEIYYDLQRYDEALDIFVRVGKLHEEILGPEHAETLYVDNELANIFTEQEKYEEAIKLFKKILQVKEKTNTKPDDECVLCLKNNIAIALAELNKKDEALIILREIADIYVKSVGENDLETLSTKHTIADILIDLQRTDEAIIILQNIVKIRSELLGPSNLLTIRAKYDLGRCFKIEGNNKKALKLFCKVLEREREIYGSDDKRTLLTEFNMGTIFISEKRYTEALTFFKHIYNIRRDTLGSDNEDTIEAKIKLDFIRTNLNS